MKIFTEEYISLIKERNTDLLIDRLKEDESTPLRNSYILLDILKLKDKDFFLDMFKRYFFDKIINVSPIFNDRSEIDVSFLYSNKVHMRDELGTDIKFSILDKYIEEDLFYEIPDVDPYFINNNIDWVMERIGLYYSVNLYFKYLESNPTITEATDIRICNRILSDGNLESFKEFMDKRNKSVYFVYDKFFKMIEKKMSREFIDNSIYEYLLDKALEDPILNIQFIMLFCNSTKLNKKNHIIQYIKDNTDKFNSKYLSDIVLSEIDDDFKSELLPYFI